MTTEESIAIEVLLFASAREAAGGVSSLQVKLGSGADTTMLRKYLSENYPNLSPLVKNEDYITLALNEEYIPKGEVLPLKAGDVVALIPPISGG